MVHASLGPNLYPLPIFSFACVLLFNFSCLTLFCAIVIFFKCCDNHNQKPTSDQLKNMQILLSRTQAGPGRAGKQEQEQTSRKHIQIL